jgi:3-oxoacyl-[acyl-carrier protein] reductase
MNFEQKIQSPVIEKEKIILTGGTEGIGRAIALELSEQNHDVAICARTQEKLDEMKNSSKVEAYQLDLSNTDKIEDFIKQSSEKLGGLNVLILNAAVTGIRESKDYTLKVDYEAQKALVESASDLLRASNGRIVFLTSVQAKKFIEGHEHYGQAKKNAEDWLKEFSDKEENKNIQIFLVNPGHVDTRMNDEAINYGVESIRERSVKAKNEGKFRDPQIVGRIISKMSISGNKFNAETSQYDIPILNNEIVAISDDNVKFESEKI